VLDRYGGIFAYLLEPGLELLCCEVSWDYSLSLSSHHEEICLPDTNLVLLWWLCCRNTEELVRIEFSLVKR